LGGDFEHCALLSKKALCRPIGQRNSDPRYAKLEQKITKSLNELGLGAGGYGGKMTVMDTFIEKAPCHIASLPVALNIGCHSTRHANILI
jgi:fumarate hydratase subunit alpha